MGQSSLKVEIDFAKHLNLTGDMAMRDIWAHKDAGSGSFLQLDVPSYDSAFYMLSAPKSKAIL
jgi:hypothetical protein